MKKKIIVMSILAVFVFSSLPIVSVAQINQANNNYENATDFPTTVLNNLINDLTSLNDFIFENYPNLFEEEFLENLQNDIDILGQGFENEIFCNILLDLGDLMVEIYDTLSPILGQAIVFSMLYPILSSLETLWFFFCYLPNNQSCACELTLDANSSSQNFSNSN